MTSPKVSIIIPAYNAQGSIARCLTSVIEQTLAELEILVIDDGSTDQTMAILQQYAKKDARIRVLGLLQNSGVAVARNLGIDLAKGTYLGFIDADDYIDRDFYEKLYACAVESGADIVSGNASVVRHDGSYEKLDKLVSSFKKSKFNFTYTLWIGIFKTLFIRDNKIYNPVGVITSQDTVFCIKCGCLANKIEIVLDVYYHYVRVQNSLSSNILSEEKIKSKLEAFRQSVDFVNTLDIEEDDYNRALFEFFMFICVYGFYRNTKKETRMLLLKASIEGYRAYRYKNKIQQINPELCRYLESDDLEGLYSYNDRFRKGANETRIKLFGFIKIKIKKDFIRGSASVSIFGIRFLSYTLPREIRYSG